MDQVHQSIFAERVLQGSILHLIQPFVRLMLGFPFGGLENGTEMGE